MHKNIIVNLTLIFNVSVWPPVHLYRATLHTVPRPLPWKWIHEAMFVTPGELRLLTQFALMSVVASWLYMIVRTQKIAE